MNPKYDVSLLGKEVESFLKLKSKSTRETYKWGFVKFLDFYQGKHGKDKGMGHFMDRIFNNLKKPRREQGPRLIESEFVDFIEYLKESGISANSVRVYIAALQNFLKYYNITVSISFIENIPQPIPQKVNDKHEWKIEEIKQFVDLASTYRDKAIILCFFQSGMGGSELFNINYGDIQDEYEKGIVPIHMRFTRKKTGVPFRTFFGRDAVRHLRLYLATRKDLQPDSPLFTKWNSDTERMTIAAAEMKFREIAPDLDFMKESDMEGFNPCRPHSLRAAFISRLTGKIDRVLIEFWAGHDVGEEKRTYLKMPTEELRELYMDAEKYLAIEKTSRDEAIEQKTVKTKVTAHLQREIQELKTTLQGLTKQYNEATAENSELKRRMGQVELEIMELKKVLEKLID